VLYEVEQSLVRPSEIERRLELARFLHEAQRARPGRRERLLLLLSDLLISLGEYIRERSGLVAPSQSAYQSMEY
jgi:hypothetical protein